VSEETSNPVAQNGRLSRTRFRGADRPSGAPRPSIPNGDHSATRTGLAKKPKARRAAPRNSASRRFSSRDAQPGRVSTPAAPGGSAGVVVRGIGACNPVVKDEYPGSASACRSERAKTRPSGGCRASRRFTRFAPPLRAHGQRSLPAVLASGEALTLPDTKFDGVPRGGRRRIRIPRPLSTPSARERLGACSGLECLPPTRARTPRHLDLAAPDTCSAVRSRRIAPIRARSSGSASGHNRR
jgi:hypothetical protein